MLPFYRYRVNLLWLKSPLPLEPLNSLRKTLFQQAAVYAVLVKERNWILIAFPGADSNGEARSVYKILIKGVKVYEHIF